MLPYLHILVRVEEDGSLHALGAFTSKEKLQAYLADCGLDESRTRLDFFNGPFEEGIKVVYAGHRRWNMQLFQLAGYFKDEVDAWTEVSREGYVSVLRIDTTYEDELKLEKEALEHYARLQRRWRLASYEELVDEQGSEKVRADIKLRFYADALESFKPKTKRDRRALVALCGVALCFPFAGLFYIKAQPAYGENEASVSWLPGTASNVSYYRSKQVQVYEFKISSGEFKRWAESQGMRVRRLIGEATISRFRAYIPAPKEVASQPATPDGVISIEELEAWQKEISARVDQGLIAEGSDGSLAIFDGANGRAYFQHLTDFR
jgi:hypothetical protein